MTGTLGTRAFARASRSSMNADEAILWNRLRRKAVLGLGFRRQFPIGPYFADFACPAIRLVVEVDGTSHCTEEAQAYDARRRTYLQRLDWQEIRVTNEEVYQDLERVMEFVLYAAAKLKWP